jgi:hypothetical protein
MYFIMFPAVAEFTEPIIDEILSDRLPYIVLWGKDDGLEYNEAFIEAAYEFAEKHIDYDNEDRVVWLKANTLVNTEVANFAKFLGANKKKVSLSVVNYSDGGWRHTVKGVESWTKEDFIKFVLDFQEGNLEMTFKSEKIPKKQKELRAVVGDNFKEVVLDDTKDVLLLMYMD